MRFKKWVTALVVLVGLTAKLPAATVVIATPSMAGMASVLILVDRST